MVRRSNFTTAPPRRFMGRMLGWFIGGILRQALEDGSQVEFYDRPSEVIHRQNVRMVYRQNITTGPPRWFTGRILRQALQNSSQVDFLQIVHRYNVTTGPPGQFIGRILRQALKDSSQVECYDRPSRIVHRQICLDGSQVECYDSPSGQFIGRINIQTVHRYCVTTVPPVQFIVNILRHALHDGSQVKPYDMPSRIVHGQNVGRFIDGILRQAFRDVSQVAIFPETIIHYTPISAHFSNDSYSVRSAMNLAF